MGDRRFNPPKKQSNKNLEKISETGVSSSSSISDHTRHSNPADTRYQSNHPLLHRLQNYDWRTPVNSNVLTTQDTTINPNIYITQDTQHGFKVSYNETTGQIIATDSQNQTVPLYYPDMSSITPGHYPTPFHGVFDENTNSITFYNSYHDQQNWVYRVTELHNVTNKSESTPLATTSLLNETLSLTQQAFQSNNPQSIIDTSPIPLYNRLYSGLQETESDNFLPKYCTQEIPTRIESNSEETRSYDFSPAYRTQEIQTRINPNPSKSVSGPDEFGDTTTYSTQTNPRRWKEPRVKITENEIIFKPSRDQSNLQTTRINIEDWRASWEERHSDQNQTFSNINYNRSTFPELNEIPSLTEYASQPDSSQLAMGLPSQNDLSYSVSDLLLTNYDEAQLLQLVQSHVQEEIQQDNSKGKNKETKDDVSRQDERIAQLYQDSLNQMRQQTRTSQDNSSLITPSDFQDMSDQSSHEDYPPQYQAEASSSSHKPRDLNKNNRDNTQQTASDHTKKAPSQHWEQETLEELISELASVTKISQLSRELRQKLKSGFCNDDYQQVMKRIKEEGNKHAGKIGRFLYRETDKGKIVSINYENSVKRKEARKRYNISDKGIETHLRYENSDKGKNKRKMYRSSYRGKESHKRYEISDKGIESKVRILSKKTDEQIINLEAEIFELDDLKKDFNNENFASDTSSNNEATSTNAS